MPSSSADATLMDFPSLGIRDAVGVQLLFAFLKGRFTAELARAAEASDRKAILSTWQGPLSTIPARVHANWIDKAPEELRNLLFKENEELIGFINLRLGVMQTLQELGLTNAEMIRSRFATLQLISNREFQECKDEVDLGVSKIAWLGRRSGLITHITNNWLKPSPPELKRAVGQALNELKAHVEAALESRRLAIEAAADQASLAREREDLSLPGVIRPLGTRHPLRQTFEEIEKIFLSLGYSVVAGPEMETPYYNF
jgi:hypothetical protein